MPLEFSDLRRSPPLLISSDLLNRHVAEGQRNAIADNRNVLASCIDLLSLWRQHSWPVAHLRSVPRRPSLSAVPGPSDRIDELRPRPSEMIFEHVLPSAYSSARYADYMQSMRDISCVLIGFSLDETVLATAMDGFHRGHRYQLVPEAIACKKSRDCNFHEYRKATFEIIENYAGLLSSFEVFDIWGASVAKARL